jgi:hypothetical protein
VKTEGTWSLARGVADPDHGRGTVKRQTWLVLGLLLGLAPTARPQGAVTGAVYGRVTDPLGAVLPHASVSITGVEVGGARVTVTDAHGEFRFLALDPGRYRLTVSRAAFATARRDLVVTTAHSVDVTFSLEVAAVKESVTVTSETPLVDTRNFGTQTTVTHDELQSIPSGRDPWVVLQTIPGVFVDRVNIAGSESGQQSLFQGKGAPFNQTVWNVDGVNVTDMSVLGASPTHYDFDAFQEIHVSTGGNDLAAPTGGIQISLVTRRGTNRFHGTARGLFASHQLESNNLQGSGAEDRTQHYIDALPPGSRYAEGDPKANSIDQISEYGFEVGGPLIRDKMWFWGAYSRNDIRVKRLNQNQDRTILVDYNAKLTWQPGPKDIVNASWFYGARLRYGRPLGWGINEVPGSTVNRGPTADGPPGLYRAEWSHTFGPRFVANVRYGFYNSGFFTRSVEEAPPAIDFYGGTTRGGAYSEGRTTKAQHNVFADFNYFANGMGGQHELRFGLGYRHDVAESIVVVPGPHNIVTFEFGPGTGAARIVRDGHPSIGADYTSAYAADTFTRGRLTLNAGLRFDHQHTYSPASSVPANPAFPDLLPEVDVPQIQAVTWNDLTPRVGATCALDAARRTVLRASYARYASQMPSDYGLDKSASGAAYVDYDWTDLNRDHFAEPDEVDIASGPADYSPGFDPDNPANPILGNTYDPNFHSQKDDEVIVGLDRELAPAFAVSAAFTYRRATGLQWDPRTDTSGNVMTRDDYTCEDPVFWPVSGLTSAGVCRPNPAVASGFYIRTNLAGDYYRTYDGLELAAVKRLSHRWMGRLAVTWADWREHFENETVRVGWNGNPTPTDGDPLVDGGLVAPIGGQGAGKLVYYTASWQVSANVLYQIGRDIEISASTLYRQGYPMPYYVPSDSGGDGTLFTLAVDRVDQFRLPDLFDLDLRLSKEFRVGRRGYFTLIADAFNVLNKGTTLERNLTANSPTSHNQPVEILNPRIFRFGVRLGF